MTDSHVKHLFSQRNEVEETELKVSSQYAGRLASNLVRAMIDFKVVNGVGVHYFEFGSARDKAAAERMVRV